jgi:argininosuccinate lyase
MGRPVHWQDGSAVRWIAFSATADRCVDGEDGWTLTADQRNRMHAFNQSLKYDQRMHAADIQGSIAYARALARVGILTAEEERTMIEGLQAVGREWENGQVSVVLASI